MSFSDDRSTDRRTPPSNMGSGDLAGPRVPAGMAAHAISRSSASPVSQQPASFQQLPQQSQATFTRQASFGSSSPPSLMDGELGGANWTQRRRTQTAGSSASASATAVANSPALFSTGVLCEQPPGYMAGLDRDFSINADPQRQQQQRLGSVANAALLAALGSSGTTGAGLVPGGPQPGSTWNDAGQDVGMILHTVGTHDDLQLAPGPHEWAQHGLATSARIQGGGNSPLAAPSLITRRSSPFQAAPFLDGPQAYGARDYRYNSSPMLPTARPATVSGVARTPPVAFGRPAAAAPQPVFSADPDDPTSLLHANALHDFPYVATAEVANEASRPDVVTVEGDSGDDGDSSPVTPTGTLAGTKGPRRLGKKVCKGRAPTLLGCSDRKRSNKHNHGPFTAQRKAPSRSLQAPTCPHHPPNPGHGPPFRHPQIRPHVHARVHPTAPGPRTTTTIAAHGPPFTISSHDKRLVENGNAGGRIGCNCRVDPCRNARSRVGVERGGGDDGACEEKSGVGTRRRDLQRPGAAETRIDPWCWSDGLVRTAIVSGYKDWNEMRWFWLERRLTETGTANTKKTTVALAQLGLLSFYLRVKYAFTVDIIQFNGFLLAKRGRFRERPKEQTKKTRNSASTLSRLASPLQPHPSPLFVFIQHQSPQIRPIGPLQHPIPPILAA